MQNQVHAMAGVTDPLGRLHSVLIVEDEGLLAMMMEDQMREFGAERVEVCRGGAEALRLATETAFDCAILDVSVSGGSSYAVADMLAERQIPFVFCTGLQRDDIAERHRQRPVLSKPYGDCDLKIALALALSHSA